LTQIIDCHVHLAKDDPRGDRLIAEADRLGIDRLVVFATGRGGDGPENADCLAAAAAHPDRIVPFAYFRLGVEGPAHVDEFAEAGFRGMKLLRPTVDYHDASCMRVYERACERRLVLLFHLGVVAVRPDDYLYNVDTGRMRPVFLDPVLRRLPELVVIGAHLGNPWYEEAAMLCRWHRNLYFDLSGSTLKRQPPGFFRSLLWWSGQELYKDALGRDPWEKMLFGTDVAIDKMADAMSDYRRLFEGLDLDVRLRKAVMGGTAARILGLEGGT